MIACRVYRGGRLEGEDFPSEGISDLLGEDDTCIWLDAADPTAQELAMIAEEFGLHPVVVEDLEHRGQRAKIEPFEQHVFVALHALHLDERDELVDREVFAVAGRRFLVTIRYSPLFDITEVMRRWDKHPDITSDGAGFLLYVLLDEIVDDYFDVVERYEDLSEDIEDAVFSPEDPASQVVQQRIFLLKRHVVSFRRFVMPPPVVVLARRPARHDTPDTASRAR